jgi:Kef-type K+ transport system membrane component KefB
MSRLFAVVLTVGLAWVVIVVSTDGQVALGPGLLALALALGVATAAGEIMARIHLPRVSGYLLTGMLFGPHVANAITTPIVRELHPINNLAVAMIAFIAGLEMNVRRLRPRLPEIFKVGTVLLVLLYAGLFVGIWVAWPWLAVGPEFTGVQRLAAAGLMTIVVVSFSPTVTISILTETRAAGPLAELTLAVVVAGDLILIVLFTLMMDAAHVAFGGSRDVGVLIGLSWEILGSLTIGAAAGWLFALYLNRSGRELPVAFVAFCALLAVAAGLWHLEALLAALAAGLVVENVAPWRGDQLKHAVERGALPVLIVFFAAAGASLQLDALAALGIVAIAVSIGRMLSIWISMTAATRYAKTAKPIAGLAWMGFVSQAGVTLGLTLIVAAEFPGWGTRMQTLMVALIAIHELIGPVLFRTALERAGEIGKEQGELLDT